jgi:two-component system, NarL family, sensor kinase
MDGLLRAEQTTAALARFVLGAQDTERRQLAKTLHDRVAQDLVAANWINEDMQNRLRKEDQLAAKRLDEVLRQSVQSLRTVSYLLHPPLLDDEGLGVALRSLVDGWSQQTGVAIALDVPEMFGRLSPEVELTIFRLVEDALANIKEHSDSATTRVSVHRTASPSGVMITVEDVDQGMPIVHRLRAIIRDVIPRASAHSLALARMRERVLHIGGKLEITSGVGKTIIEAKIPVRGLQGKTGAC